MAANEIVRVNREDLESAFEFVSFGSGFENHACVSLDTGKIYWTSNYNDVMEEDLPDDLEESDRYIAVPSKKDLDLGRRLVLRFVDEAMPEDYNTDARRLQHCRKHLSLTRSIRPLQGLFGEAAHAGAMVQLCARSRDRCTACVVRGKRHSARRRTNEWRRSPCGRIRPARDKALA